MPESKFDREYKSHFDKAQVKFNNDGVAQRPVAPEVKKFTSVNCNVLVMCPFCLHQAKLSAFFISTKKGISEGKAECPECHNGMLMKSLFEDMSPTQYADWVFKYKAFGFWKKCPFETWKKRLASIGWAKEFWDRYKDLKTDATIENYTTSAEEAERIYEEQYSKAEVDET